MKMNEDNNEAVGWTCESEGAIALFDGELSPENCSEEVKCSWCTLKKETRWNCRMTNSSPEIEPYLCSNVGTEDDKCKFCLMNQQEWDEYVSEKLEEREAVVKDATNGYLVDGIVELEKLKCSPRSKDLESHNKSIDLCIASFTDIFNAGTDDQNWVFRNYHHVERPVLGGISEVPAIPSKTNIRAYDSTSDYQPKILVVSIEFRGKESGIKYKIDIQYRAERARILERRIDDIVQANSLYPISDAVLRGFVEASDFLNFQVYREDMDGDWDHLCVDPNGDFGLWPGDDVAALIMCLYDDLNTALEPAMYTLRHGLQDASKVAFMNGNSKASIHRLMAYEAAYKGINEATKAMPSEAVHSLVSRLKHKFSDPEYAREALAEADYGMLQDEA